MKKFLIIMLMFGLSNAGTFGQTKISDSLKLVLKNADKPIERFNIINHLALEYNTKGIWLDTAWVMEMAQIAKRTDSDSLLAISYNWLGTLFYGYGDNTTALEYYFKGIPHAERINDKRRISSLYFDMALVYFDINDPESAIKMTRAGKMNLPDTSHPLYEFMVQQYLTNSAQYYLAKKNGDSALYFANEFSNYKQRYFQDNQSYEFLRLTFLAASFALQKNRVKADDFFNQAFKLLASIKLSEHRLLLYSNYIPYLLSDNKYEGAKEAAYALYNDGVSVKNLNLKLAGANFLREVFDALNKKDSAYYYSQVEAEVRSVIFSDNNKNKLQNLAFTESLRGFEEARKKEIYRNKIVQYGLLAGLLVFTLVAVILYRNNKQKQKANELLAKTLADLQVTQKQLIQSEKMASLGELTAGIAHEIQNPLNFVNNFSELNKELLEELKEEADRGNVEEVKAIAVDVISNEEKISHHGKRADAIVKGMLQHSRSSNNQKEPTDINALADEYLRLAYHGLRAKDKSFNATLKSDYDESIGSINIVPQDIGRVILNLLTNAFYAVDEKQRASAEKYDPTVSVSTKKIGDKVEVRVSDNGNGIPQNIIDRIFQPFFTTKPTGQGTGLGLSLAYDIVKAHGGELKVKTKEGEGSEFTIELPAKQYN